MEAAAVWVAYSTAYGALFEKARIRPGDHVLITAASGGVGRAAMQIANQIGAVPIAITRDSAKKDDLLAAGAVAVIATDHEDVAEAVRYHTGGTGANIVLNLVMGPGQQDLLKAGRPGPGQHDCAVVLVQDVPVPGEATMVEFISATDNFKPLPG